MKVKNAAIVSLAILAVVFMGATAVSAAGNFKGEKNREANRPVLTDEQKADMKKLAERKNLPIRLQIFNVLYCIKTCNSIWRRKGDLNPCALLEAYELSKPAPSTTWVFLHAFPIIHKARENVIRFCSFLGFYLDNE